MFFLWNIELTDVELVLLAVLLWIEGIGIVIDRVLDIVVFIAVIDIDVVVAQEEFRLNIDRFVRHRNFL